MKSKEKKIKVLTLDKVGGSYADVPTNFGGVELPTVVYFSREDTDRLLKGEKIPNSFNDTIYKVTKKTMVLHLNREDKRELQF